MHTECCFCEGVSLQGQKGLIKNSANIKARGLKAALLVMLKRDDEAHQKITGHDFQTWEGAEGKITSQFKLSLFITTCEKTPSDEVG